MAYAPPNWIELEKARRALADSGHLGPTAHLSASAYAPAPPMPTGSTAGAHPNGLPSMGGPGSGIQPASAASPQGAYAQLLEALARGDGGWKGGSTLAAPLAQTTASGYGG